MSSIKITVNAADGSQQTFVRSAEKSGVGPGDKVVSDLGSLYKQIEEVHVEVNAALTVLVDKEKAAAGKKQIREVSDVEDDEEDDDEDDEANGDGEPPEKKQKT